MPKTRRINFIFSSASVSFVPKDCGAVSRV